MTVHKIPQILIADDNEISATYLGIFLKKMGFHTTYARNGVEVLRLLHFGHPGAILLDVGMQPMDGISVLKHLKGEEDISFIPVIMVSGDDSSETIEKCRKNGCAGYLKKPIIVQELHKVLEGCLFAARRKHYRISLNKEVVVIYNEKPYMLFTDTLSEGGVFILNNDPFPVGSEIQVIFPFLDKGSFSFPGTVVYTKKPSENDFNALSGMGIQFNGLSDDAAKILKVYIEQFFSESTQVV